jgi:hypothetical protein
MLKVLDLGLGKLVPSVHGREFFWYSWGSYELKIYQIWNLALFLVELLSYLIEETKILLIIILIILIYKFIYLEISAPEFSLKMLFFLEFGVKNNKFQIPPPIFVKKAIICKIQCLFFKFLKGFFSANFT